MPYPKCSVELVCENCNKTFTIKKSLSKNRRFCGAKCRSAFGETLKEIRKCQQCGSEFKDYRTNERAYCSISCAVTARNLTDKNPSYSRDISGNKNPMFGIKRIGDKNPMFGKRKPDARKTRKDGYTFVRAPEGHPHPSDISGGIKYILEHRLVMENHLGRYLEPQEVVHHIDGDPSNNDISNLVLYKNQSDHIRLGHGSSD